MSDLLDIVVVSSPFAGLAPLYEIDPDADVLLNAPSSKTPFAPWDDPLQQVNVNRKSSSTTAAAPASRPGLRIKVSSKHLSLASRIFRNKLQFGVTKAARQSDGRIHLELADGFDPKAVTIALNAVHGRGSKVPKSVDLETLAQIALFVDRFQLYDAVEVYADRWISKLDDQLPENYGRDLVLWIYVSHVFRNAEVFSTVTKTAATQAPGPIRDLGLPIREKIIKHIDEQRQDLVSKGLDVLHTTLETLAEGRAPCPKFQCDSFVLGELIKTLHKSRLVWPRPSKPFPGVSFSSISESVDKSFQFQTSLQRDLGVGLWEKHSGGTGGRLGNSNGKVKAPLTPDSSPEPVSRTGSNFDLHNCDARRLVSKLDDLYALEDGVAGLELESSLGYRVY